MNLIRIYKIAKVLLAIGKTLVPVLEEVFQKDLDKDGHIGKAKK